MLNRTVSTPDGRFYVREEPLRHLAGDESAPLRDCLLDYRELPALAAVMVETMAKQPDATVAWAMDGAELTYLLSHVAYDVIHWRRVLVTRDDAGRLVLATYNHTAPEFERDALITRGSLDDGAMVRRDGIDSIYVRHALVDEDV